MAYAQAFLEGFGLWYSECNAGVMAGLLVWVILYTVLEELLEGY